MVRANTYVRPHTRNGRPVRGYTQRRTYAERISDIIRGNYSTTLGAAVAKTAVVGVGIATFTVLTVTLDVGWAALVTAGGALSLLLGESSTRKYRRRRRARKPYRVRRRYVTPMDRLHRMRVRTKRRYGHPVRRHWKRHPVQAAGYDRWLRSYTVVAKPPQGSKAGERRKTVRGWKARTTLLNESKAKAPRWKYTVEGER